MPVTPFALQHLARGILEEVVPDDVARQQALGLRREECRGLVRAGEVGRPPERALEPLEAADPELHGLDRGPLLVAELAGRADRLRARDDLLLALRVAVQLRLELLLLHAGLGEQLAEVLADRGGGRGDVRDLAHVVLERAALARAAAALHPEDEQHDDQDRDRDQSDEPKQRRYAGRRARRRWRPGDAPHDARLRRRGLLRRRLVIEELEIEVVVTFGHGGLSPFGPDHCNPSSGP